MDRLGRLVAMLVAGLALAGEAYAGGPAARGRQLFVGEAHLPGRVAGQDFVLPAEASRCTNCHVTASAPGTAGPTPTGPTLTATFLLQPQRRRGGPPSAYDAAALCRLLRSGVDPAYVLVQRTMPRYELNEADCQALWTFLSTPP